MTFSYQNCIILDGVSTPCSIAILYLFVTSYPETSSEYPSLEFSEVFGPWLIIISKQVKDNYRLQNMVSALHWFAYVSAELYSRLGLFSLSTNQNPYYARQ